MQTLKDLKKQLAKASKAIEKLTGECEELKKSAAAAAIDASSTRSSPSSPAR